MSQKQCQEEEKMGGFVVVVTFCPLAFILDLLSSWASIKEEARNSSDSKQSKLEGNHPPRGIILKLQQSVLSSKVCVFSSSKNAGDKEVPM